LQNSTCRFYFCGTVSYFVEFVEWVPLTLSRGVWAWSPSENAEIRLHFHLTRTLYYWSQNCGRRKAGIAGSSLSWVPPLPRLRRIITVTTSSILWTNLSRAGGAEAGKSSRCWSISWSEPDGKEDSAKPRSSSVAKVAMYSIRVVSKDEFHVWVYLRKFSASLIAFSLGCIVAPAHRYDLCPSISLAKVFHQHETTICYWFYTYCSIVYNGLTVGTPL
jgi:hypothetical protein